MLSLSACVYMRRVTALSLWPSFSETDAMSAPFVIAIEANEWRSLCGCRFAIPYLLPKSFRYSVGVCGCMTAPLFSCVKTNSESMQLLICSLRNSCNFCMTSGQTSITLDFPFLGVSRYTPFCGVYEISWFRKKWYIYQESNCFGEIRDSCFLVHFKLSGKKMMLFCVDFKNKNSCFVLSW